MIRSHGKEDIIGDITGDITVTGALGINQVGITGDITGDITIGKAMG